jgi:hypothetical protein
MKGIVNHIRAVDVLASMPEVDSSRIGTIGLSLGGHNALFLAVFEPRIRAVVSSAGFNTFTKYYGGNLKGWTSNRYMPRIASVFQSRPERMPFDFTEVLAAIAPRPVFVTGGTRDQWADPHGEFLAQVAAGPVYRLLGGKDLGVADLPMVDTPIVNGDLGFHYHTGGHTIMATDWQAFLQFAERTLRAR